MWSNQGYYGYVIDIPETVFDEKGVKYTVKALAGNALNYLYPSLIILPETMESLNNGCMALPSLNAIKLPLNLKVLEGIVECRNLRSIIIPNTVEEITGLRKCGLETVYLPISVKKLGNNTLANCGDLTSVYFPALQTMGDHCLSNCRSLMTACLPKTLQSMGIGCFNSCEGLLGVSLPSNPIQMNDCFNGCSNIEYIEVYSPEPYPFPQDCFRDVDRKKCILYVPRGSQDKYGAADGWKEFFNIQEFLVSDVKAVNDSSDFSFICGNGVVTVDNRMGVPLEISDLNGVKIVSMKKSGINEVVLPPGVYIMTSPSGSKKFSVK